MSSRTPANRVIGVCLFIAAVVFTALAVCLFILGEFPAIRIDDNSYMMFGGITVNGVAVPDWAFYLIPAGVLLIAIILAFVGWRMSRVSGNDGS